MRPKDKSVVSLRESTLPNEFVEYCKGRGYCADTLILSKSQEAAHIYLSLVLDYIKETMNANL